jgi:hypothetical protein
MKSKMYGCYCCSIHKDDLVRPNASTCTDCVWLGLTQPCYHKPVLDENMIERLRQARERKRKMNLLQNFHTSLG